MSRTEAVHVYYKDHFYDEFRDLSTELKTLVSDFCHNAFCFLFTAKKYILSRTDVPFHKLVSSLALKFP